MIQLWMRWQKLNVRVKIDLVVKMAVKTSLVKFLMDHHQESGKTGISSISNGKRYCLTHKAHHSIMVDNIMVLIVMILITIIQTFMLGSNGPKVIMIGQKIDHKDQMPLVMEDKAGSSIDVKSSKAVITSLKEELETLSLPKSF